MDEIKIEVEIPAGRVFLVAPKNWTYENWKDFVDALEWQVKHMDNKFILLPPGTQVIQIIEPEQPE